MPASPEEHAAFARAGSAEDDESGVASPKRKIDAQRRTPDDVIDRSEEAEHETEGNGREREWKAAAMRPLSWSELQKTHRKEQQRCYNRAVISVCSHPPE